MKKGIVLAVLACVLVVSLVIAGCAPAPAPTPSPAPAPAPAPTPPARPVELRFAHGWATTHHVHVVIDAWTKEVEKATEGRVKITIYPGGTLAGAVQLYDAVSTGAVDLAWFLQGMTPGKFPLSSVIELPFMATSATQASQVTWGLYEKFPELKAEYAGVKVLWLWTVDTGQLMTTKKAVRVVDDMKGLKLRVGSATQNPMTEALGAVPVLMPIGELYDALQKGVVDGTLLGTSAVNTFKLHDVIKYMTVGHFFINAQGVAINSNSWAKIPARDQKIIEDISGRKMAETTGKSFEREAKAGFDAASGARVEIIQLPAAEMDKWKRTVSGIYQQWINDMKAKGLPAQAVFDEANKLAQQYK